MKNNKITRSEKKDVKLENMIREVCKRLADYTPTGETTEFIVSEILRLEDACKQLKCKLTDI